MHGKIRIGYVKVAPAISVQYNSSTNSERSWEETGINANVGSHFSNLNMPENAKVTVRYGPYRSCGTVEHRTFRLKGLQDLLQENGHSVDLECTDHWHTVEIVVNGESVYKCDIRNLEFGGDGKLDKCCHEALEAVIQAF